LNKVELDIPCLRLSEDGKLLGVLKEVLALCPKGDYCHDNAPLEFEEEDLILTTEFGKVSDDLPHYRGVS
jgi:hypothetical protein